MTSTVEREIAEQPLVLQRLITRPVWDGVTRRVAARAREGALTVARGSSDHAATYFAYLLLVHAKLPTASIPPSVATLYHRRPRGAQRVALGVSQSGRSPDVVAALGALRQGGALALAVTNDESSPLAAAAEEVLALGCGTEHAVAATKSFTASLAALACLALRWAERRELVSALERVPEACARALDVSVQDAAHVLARAPDAFVLARGFGYAVAREAALKLKEIARVRAEAESAAEFLHGPVASVEAGLPVLVVVATDEPARGPCLEAAARIAQAGGRLLLAGATESEAAAVSKDALALDVGRELPGELAPIAQAVLLQRLAVATALAKGLDPDSPRNLVKVTRTW
jgi:glucosamine--fructose-6-phosphate aminotransferase (isomerizing)